MSDNPYAAPHSPSSYIPYRPPPGESLRGPGIALVSISILWILILGAMIPFDVYLIVSGAAKELGDEFQASGVPKEVQIIVRMGFGLLLISLQGVVLWGGISMLQVKNFGVAYAAAIISVIPCCSGCYFVGIPFGIWALVVLNRPEVKASFR